MLRRRLALFAPALLLDRAATAQVQQQQQQQPQTLRIAGLPDVDAQVQVAQRLLGDVYRRAGLSLRLVSLPPARSILAIKTKQVDGEMMRIRSYGDQHPELLRVEPAFYRITVHAFSLLSRQIQVRRREDLLSYSLGVLRGVSYVPEIAAGHKALTLAQDNEQLLRMLQAQRIDLTLDGLLSGRVTLARLGLADTVNISAELGRFELFHYLRVDQRSAAQRLGSTIQRMRASGELERLTTQYESALMAKTASSSSFP